MPDPGIQLQVRIGKTKPEPVPQKVINALLDVEVQNRDNARDGFQMTFTLGRESKANDFFLLRDQLVEPGRRVILTAQVRGQAYILIDGIITRHQVMHSQGPGSARLVVTGEDISLKMDLEEKRVTYPNQSDSSIVKTILGRYGQFGLEPNVTSTKDQPDSKVRTPAQGSTDLSYIRMLAQRNGFIFYVEPSNTAGKLIAYWGPDKREGSAQPPLTMNMGAYNNIESLNFGFDALQPTKASVNTLDVSQREIREVSSSQSLRKTLAGESTDIWRITLPPATSRLSSAQAELLALTSAMETSDAATCNGEVNTVRYGGVLRARRLVGVRGAGNNYDGEYYVKQVTHRLSRGKYTQSFTLVREGRRALKKTVTLGSVS